MKDTSEKKKQVSEMPGNFNLYIIQIFGLHVLLYVMIRLDWSVFEIFL